MKVNLTESEILTIREALETAPSACNYDDGYLRSFRALYSKFKSLAYNTRYERSRRQALARAIHWRSP